MLINFMFHDVVAQACINPEKKIEKFLLQIKQQYNIINPGDQLVKYKKNACLVFDDAYFDFYHIIFPLLKKYEITATLAIATDFILETTELNTSSRIKLIANSPLKNQQKQACASLCTWREIQEMVNSNLVIAASHTCSHHNLKKTTSPQNELIKSKQLLEQRLKTDITTLVLPYGGCNRQVLKQAKQYYSTIMRIGGAANISWNNLTGYSYRIDADQLWPQARLPTAKDYFIYGCNWLKNTLRGR